MKIVAQIHRVTAGDRIAMLERFGLQRSIVALGNSGFHAP
jgi:hypothetical protein